MQRNIIFNPHKIGLWGESAGAHIACMAGSDYNNRNIIPVQGIVSFYCPSNLVEMLEEQNGNPGFLVNVLPDYPLSEEEQIKVFEKMSPVYYADKKSIPPILLFHGDKDEVVNYRQSCEYKMRLDDAGNNAELIIVQGQGHGFFRGSGIL